MSDNNHFLNLDEENYPEEFRIIIRRLLKAAAEKDVCETMDLEDEIIDELESMERKILDKDKALVANAKDLADKDKAINNALEALVNSGMTLNPKFTT